MKKWIYLSLLSFTFISCVEIGGDINEYTEYVPILMTRSALEADFKIEPAKAIVNAGKIYSYQDYLFVNELYEGIHVIDHTNPENPIKMAFLKIIGNVDLSIRNNILFADNAVDLIAIDLKATEPKIINREKRVFKSPTPPDGLPVPEKYLNLTHNGEETVIIRWELPE